MGRNIAHTPGSTIDGAKGSGVLVDHNPPNSAWMLANTPIKLATMATPVFGTLLRISMERPARLNQQGNNQIFAATTLADHGRPA